MGAILNILWPVQWLLAWIMDIWHTIFSFIPGFAQTSGVWTLSIVFMTITVKAALLPLLLRQIKSMRKMQGIQPEMKAIQRKYKDKKDTASRQAMSQETMALYKKHGVNPMGSCVPMLFQGPILFSLYGLLSKLDEISAGTEDPVGPITKEVSLQIQESYFFFAKLSDTFSTDDLGGKITIIVCIIFMSVSMFLSQNFNIRYNTPVATQGDQQFKTQKIMSFLFPVMYIFTGVNVPAGVLVYWIISNFWMLGQTLFTLYYMPTPGSKAYEIKEKRDHDKGVAKGLIPAEPEIIPPSQRPQPVSKKRGKKK